MGLRVAHSFEARGVLDYLDVAPGYGIARVPDLRTTYGVTLIALHRGGNVTLNPTDSEVLQASDELIVAGLDDDLERLPGNTPAAGP